MMRYRFVLLILLMTFQAHASNWHVYNCVVCNVDTIIPQESDDIGLMLEESERAKQDSIRRVEQELESKAQAAKLKREQKKKEEVDKKNEVNAETKVPSFDVQTKILDGRHTYKGDQFSKRWKDNISILAGLGLERIDPPNETYEFEPVTSGMLGVAKDIDARNTFRLSGRMGVGFLHEKDIVLRTYAIQFDHLFNLSSYFNGYRPDRLLEFSTLLGIGFHRSRLGGHNSTTSTAWEAHAGLQLKFYAGPRSTIQLEPYVKYATNGYDLDRTRKSRFYDFAYGVNLHFSYYLNMNLSHKENAGDFRVHYDKSGLRDKSGKELYDEKYRQSVIKRKEDTEYHRTFASDSALAVWRSPWFVEFGGGLSMLTNGGWNMWKTRQPSLAISAGKWFSPAIGLRISGEASFNKWNTHTTAATEVTPEYRVDYNGGYIGVRADGIINVLGLRRNYNWQTPVGLNLLMGLQLGRIGKFEDGPHLSTYFVAYSAGGQLWARLSDDLRVFVEPSYTHYTYRIPYSNVNWNKKFSDDVLAVRLGITMLMNKSAYRQQQLSTYSQEQDMSKNHFYVGLGGGINTLIRKYQNHNNTLLNPNGMAYGGYRFTHVHGAELGFQYLATSNTDFTTYLDRNPQANFISTRRGLWQRTYYTGLASLNYVCSLSSLFSAYTPERRCSLDFFTGPVYALRFGETDKLDESEHATSGNERIVKDQTSFYMRFGWNAGFNLQCRVSRRGDFNLFFRPAFYYFSTNKIFNISDNPNVTALLTFNAGLQYTF